MRTSINTDFLAGFAFRFQAAKVSKVAAAGSPFVKDQRPCRGTVVRSVWKISVCYPLRIASDVMGCQCHDTPCDPGVF